MNLLLLLSPPRALFCCSEIERDGAVLVVDNTSLEFVKGATVSGIPETLNLLCSLHSTTNTPRLGVVSRYLEGVSTSITSVYHNACQLVSYSRNHPTLTNS